jgi:hypothetical protein
MAFFGCFFLISKIINGSVAFFSSHLFFYSFWMLLMNDGPAGMMSVANDSAAMRATKMPHPH